MRLRSLATLTSSGCVFSRTSSFRRRVCSGFRGACAGAGEHLTAQLSGERFEGPFVVETAHDRQDEGNRQIARRSPSGPAEMLRLAGTARQSRRAWSARNKRCPARRSWHRRRRSVLSAKLSRYRPIAVSTAEPVSIPTGESRCAIGPAKCREREHHHARIHQDERSADAGRLRRAPSSATAAARAQRRPS